MTSASRPAVPATVGAPASSTRVSVHDTPSRDDQTWPTESLCPCSESVSTYPAGVWAIAGMDQAPGASPTKVVCLQVDPSGELQTVGTLRPASSVTAPATTSEPSGPRTRWSPLPAGASAWDCQVRPSVLSDMVGAPPSTPVPT